VGLATLCGGWHPILRCNCNLAIVIKLWPHSGPGYLVVFADTFLEGMSLTLS